MKNLLLVSLILLSGVLLTACGKKDKEPTENIEPTQNVESREVTKVNNCEKVIQEYLEGSNKEGQGEEIKQGDNIIVDYIGRLTDGTVFDTSIESIAKACDKYNEARDYTEGLSFQAMGGQMVKGFDEAVIGMKLGQTKTVQFGPEKGYGEYDESLIVTAPISEVGDISQFSEGDTIYLGMGYPAKIIKITDKDVTFDMNSELAGKDLIFDITVKSIN